MIEILSAFAWLTFGGSDAVDVCKAASLTKPTVVTVRALGQVTADGLVLGDLTCPAARSGDERLPSMILVAMQSYRTPTVKRRYEAMYEGSGKESNVQALVRGKIECVRDLKFSSRNDGDFLAGNGYGTERLMKCRIRSAELISLEIVPPPLKATQRK